MSTSEPGSGNNCRRWQFGLIAVALGVLAILAAFRLVMWNWRDGRGLVALGVIASPIAAMVGAYFGVQVTVAAAQDAQKRAATSESEKTGALVDVATPMGTLQAADAQAIGPQLRTVRYNDSLSR